MVLLMLVVRSTKSLEMETRSGGAQSKQANRPSASAAPTLTLCSLIWPLGGAAAGCVTYLYVKKTSYLFLTSQLMTSDSLCSIVTMVTECKAGLFSRVGRIQMIEDVLCVCSDDDD